MKPKKVSKVRKSVKKGRSRKRKKVVTPQHILDKDTNEFALLMSAPKKKLKPANFAENLRNAIQRNKTLKSEVEIEQILEEGIIDLSTGNIRDNIDYLFTNNGEIIDLDDEGILSLSSENESETEFVAPDFKQTKTEIGISEKLLKFEEENTNLGDFRLLKVSQSVPKVKCFRIFKETPDLKLFENYIRKLDDYLQFRMRNLRSHNFLLDNWSAQDPFPNLDMANFCWIVQRFKKSTNPFKEWCCIKNELLEDASLNEALNNTNLQFRDLLVAGEYNKAIQIWTKIRESMPFIEDKELMTKILSDISEEFGVSLVLQLAWDPLVFGNYIASMKCTTETVCNDNNQHPLCSALKFVLNICGKDCALLNGSYNRATPFHVAARFANKCQLKVLLEFGAKLDILDSDERSAIDHAIMFGNLENVKLLIDYKSPIDMQKVRKLSPVTHRNKEFLEVLNYLQQKYEGNQLIT